MQLLSVRLLICLILRLATAAGKGYFESERITPSDRGEQNAEGPENPFATILSLGLMWQQMFGNSGLFFV